jgi:hypothetical protein
MIVHLAIEDNDVRAIRRAHRLIAAAQVDYLQAHSC